MCGIVAIMRRRSARSTPSPDQITSVLAQTFDSLSPIASESNKVPDPDTIGEVANQLGEVDRLLRGEPGVRALLEHPGLAASVDASISELDGFVAGFEADLVDRLDTDHIEQLNSALVHLKDVLWAIKRDRLRAAQEIRQLAGGGPVSSNALPWLFSIQQTFSNIDRLEVRGRDSAGIHILVHNVQVDVDSAEFRTLLSGRMSDPQYPDRSVRVLDGAVSFVYKAAAEIGELGDNTARMRASIARDELLHRILSMPDAQVAVLAHTRWASVGIISEPNAHPINSEEWVDGQAQSAGPYAVGVLNGDVDNFADLMAQDQVSVPQGITTDTKVIPTLVSRGVAAGLDLFEAVRSSVARFEGSVAVGISTVAAPTDLFLALRGSGQGLFIGLAEDAFVVASEPYGVVEDCYHYLRMDGDSSTSGVGHTSGQGQILRLDATLAGLPSGVTRTSYDGSELAVGEAEWIAPSVTTRDIDLGDSPHYLLKEIGESPRSFEKTLRGRLVEAADGTLSVQLPAETISGDVARKLKAIRRIDVVGQGTAAVAGEAIAAAISAVVDRSVITVRAITATELSGFELAEDMTDTLVVAISQSGTTTDTNRTVDLVRSRGGVVLAIVNRRASDLSEKADGVLYTSDGRDVEMSVASTKAFYAQIAAGFLLADALADIVEGDKQDDGDRQAVLASLKAMPAAMETTIGLRSHIAEAAQRHAPSRRYWAIVGNGTNLVAAREVRIKLSELCYKSIACDVIEDKKHIDLSCEPLILVCAAGLSGSNADDVAKEVAIFRAHKAAPIVIATEGENRFSSALEVIAVPQVHHRLAFVLSTVVGHLFGYEAALAIDASARPLREARGVIERYVNPTDPEWFTKFNSDLELVVHGFFSGLRAGTYNGHLEASTASQVAALLRFGTGAVALESYQLEMGKVGTPGVVVEDLARALTDAIDELTRPIDAIKHQAKTVTVGISRADESLLQESLTKLVLATGTPRDRLSYATLRTLAAISPAVSDLLGHTRYRVEGDPNDEASVYVVSKSGIADGLRSRAEDDPVLRGTKRRVAVERELIVTVGSDGRVVLIIPEVKDAQTTGITLCHLSLNENLGADAARTLLTGYRNRYRQLVDVVTEREPSFRDDLLSEVSTIDLLTAPITSVASHWVRR